MRPVEQKICPECNTSFDCGGNCWCSKYPPIMPLTPNEGCYCQKCFHTIMVKRVEGIMDDPTPEMIQKIKTLGPTKQLIEDIDYSINTEGVKVFTEWYLLRNE